MREGLRVLRNNEVLAVLMDQAAGAEGVFVPMFGRIASTRDVLAQMALRLGAPLFFVWSCREPGERRHRIRVKGPLDLPDTGDREMDVHLLTCRLNEMLEDAVRQHPEQWSWRHRRWKEPVFPTDLVYDPAVGFYRGHPARLVARPPEGANGRAPAVFHPWTGPAGARRTPPERAELDARARANRRPSRKLELEQARCGSVNPKSEIPNPKSI